jgi:hypothetical protein
MQGKSIYIVAVVGFGALLTLYLLFVDVSFLSSYPGTAPILAATENGDVLLVSRSDLKEALQILATDLERRNQDLTLSSISSQAHLQIIQSIVKMVSFQVNFIFLTLLN